MSLKALKVFCVGGAGVARPARPAHDKRRQYATIIRTATRTRLRGDAVSLA